MKCKEVMKPVKRSAAVEIPGAPKMPHNTWPRYDPSRDFWLCEGCWNNQDWAHRCALGLCECPRCRGMKPPRKVKFTREGQLEIPDAGGIEIGPRS